MENKTTLIRVKIETKNRLLKKAKYGDTIDSIIEALLDKSEKNIAPKGPERPSKPKTQSKPKKAKSEHKKTKSTKLTKSTESTDPDDIAREQY